MTNEKEETREERIRRQNRAATRRYRLRKKGIDVPKLKKGRPKGFKASEETKRKLSLPRKKGYKQSAEHIEKRKRFGADHHAWLGDEVSVRGGRTRALRAYPEMGPCTKCGEDSYDRHHKDGNTANNEPDNIEFLCRDCHMRGDGRLPPEEK